MNPEKLQHTINLSDKIGYDFFVTLDGKVSPRIEATEKPALISRKKLKIKAWIDPDVVEQLLAERRISLIILQESGKKVFKVAGRLDKINKLEHINETQRQQQNRLYDQQALYEFVIAIDRIDEMT